MKNVKCQRRELQGKIKVRSVSALQEKRKTLRFSSATFFYKKSEKGRNILEYAIICLPYFSIN